MHSGSKRCGLLSARLPNKMLFADDRRIGNHGIGRFARNVLAGLEYRAISLKTDPDSPLDPVRLARALRHLQPGDLFFSPGYNPPLSCPVPFVITLHDLNHLDRPENSNWAKRLYYASIVKRACYQAAYVLTVSEFSRKRIIEWSGISSEKVVVVGCGVGPEFTPAATPCPLSFPYIYCAGNRKGHKNELRQLEAFLRCDLAPEIKLVFTGEADDELRAAIERNRATGRIHFMGRVPDGQLPSLYRSAICVLFASLYEGFGIPIIEAMAAGTPVITSNTTAMPETAGDAAVLVDPTSIEQITGALRRVMTDASLRSALRERGLARANHFPWARATTAVLQILQECAKARKGKADAFAIP